MTVKLEPLELELLELLELFEVELLELELLELLELFEVELLELAQYTAVKGTVIRQIALGFIEIQDLCKTESV